MKQVIIGVDTSCYTTSLCAVDAQGRVLQEERIGLEVKAGGRGLRQSEAVFQHIRNLPVLAERLDGALWEQTALVAVSTAPRNGADSYMPVFKAGESFARTLAASRQVPLVTTDHQLGHVYAGIASSGILQHTPLRQLLDEPILALHNSGGTLEVVLFHGDQRRIMAHTADISAGQLLDRIGVALGAPFPAGPTMETWARACHEEIPLIPARVSEGKCFLAGAETQLLRTLSTRSKEQIAAAAFSCIARAVEKMILYACEQTGQRQVILTGGVSSSALLRELLTARLAKHDRSIRCYFCQPNLSSDNAFGVAFYGSLQGSIQGLIR